MWQNRDGQCHPCHIWQLLLCGQAGCSKDFKFYRMWKPATRRCVAGWARRRRLQVLVGRYQTRDTQNADTRMHFLPPKPVAYSARTLRSSLFPRGSSTHRPCKTLSSAGLSGSQFKMIWKLLAVAVLFFLAVLVTLTALAMLFFLAVLVLLLAAWLPAMFLFRRGLWANEKH